MSSIVLKRFYSSGLQEWAYKLSGFNKYGLWRDDLHNEAFDENVRIALQRLPPKLLEERNFRILRAVQLSLQSEVLPKECWTKLDDDKLYLTPYIEEVMKEKQEEAEWNNNH